MFDDTLGGRPEYQLGGVRETHIWARIYLRNLTILSWDHIDDDALDASCRSATVANNYNVLRKWMSSHQFHFNSISNQFSLEIG